MRYLVRKAFCLLLAFPLLTACEQEELPGPVYDRGDVSTAQVAMGPTYKQQIWFDLGTNRVVKTNARTDWDLAFDCGPDGPWVYLNSSLVMQAAVTNTTDFNAVKSAAGLTFNVDAPSGNRDSLAIGDWRQHGKVFIIDRGYNENGSALGFRKIQLLGLKNGVFSLRYANLNGTGEDTAYIAKDAAYNTTAFSFTTRQAVQIEPPKTDYDLCFTVYTHVFYNPYMLYSVNGVLLNPYQTEAARAPETDFTAVTAATMAQYTYSSAKNYIGYSWKDYIFADNRYVVNPLKNYVVKDSEGFYYKLHFTGFYDDQGQKGAPKFEFRKL